MKTLFFLFLTLLGQVAYSHEMLTSPCGQAIVLEKYPEFEAIKKHLDWHGATNSVIKRAPCKNMKILDPSELDDYIAKKAQEKKGQVSTKVNGVSFEDESPVLIKAFTNLTTAMDGFGISKDTAAQKNFQKEFSINPECKKVSCAVSKIWGEQLGRKLLYVYLKHGFNSSEYAFSSSDRLNIDEIDDIILGLEDLPKQYIPLGRGNQRLTHFSRGYHLKGDSESVAANAVVMLFDTWSIEPRFERQYSIFHELSHNISTKLNGMDESNAWLKISEWVKKGENWSHGSRACFASKYGLTNPWEDYAEALSTYRYNPKDFKERCPEKYNFIKANVFKGLEYLSDSTCNEVPAAKLQSLVNELVPDIEKGLSGLSIDKNLIKEKCASVLSKYPVEEGDLRACELQLVQEQITKVPSETMSLLLTKNKIALDSARLPQLQAALAETMMNSGALHESASNLSASVTSATTGYYDDFIKSSLPQEVDGKIQGFEMSLFDFSFKEKCRKEIWSGDMALKRKCASDYLIGEDRRWSSIGFIRSGSKFKFPEGMDEESKKALLEKYYSELEKVFTQTSLLDSQILKPTNDIKVTTKQFFGSVHFSLYSDNSWKKLEPKEFCQKYFAPGDYYKKYIIPSGSDGFPGFQEWCEQKQSEKRKRFEFSDEDINNWINSVLK